MSSGMNLEQAKEYAKTMTYREAVANVKSSKGIKYRKATMIKLRELAEIADRLDTTDTPQTDCTKPIECEDCSKHICYGCEHQAEKAEWLKAQADCAWK